MSRDPSPLQDSKTFDNRQHNVVPQLQHQTSTSDSKIDNRQRTTDIDFAHRTWEHGAGFIDGPTNPAQLSQAQPPLPNQTSTRDFSLLERLRKDYEKLKQRHRDVPHTEHEAPCLPTPADFPSSIHAQIVPERSRKSAPAVKHVIVLLHHSDGPESSLKDLAMDLNEKRPEISFVLLRGPSALLPSKSGYHWVDSPGDWDGNFLEASEFILTRVIKDSLIRKCGFTSRDILLVGHRQGGTAAMATVTLWNDIELGGVVSIGGPLPSYLQGIPNQKAERTMKSKTPALAMGGAGGELTDRALNSIKARFCCVDTCIRPGEHDNIPDSKESMKSLLDFLAHRLGREEWEQQAVLSFDGGGIRGYGSLLILQDLMNKIGDEERRLDDLERKEEKTVSSFSPWPYKPVIPDIVHEPRSRRSSSKGSLDSWPAEAKKVVPSKIKDLPNSSLFLPCHYFDYAVGTSTGGLISIMLSRLRMTVDDCIAEYKNLGQKIFGHPRHLAFGAVIWHKFNYRVLEAVIKDVTARHSEESVEYEPEFPSDHDLSRTLVMAFEEHNETDAPYLFRTYYTSAPSVDQRRTRQRQTTARNHGQPPHLRIWQVGRATSAAPKYFPPIRIQKGVGHGTQDSVRFKDGGFGCNNPSEEAYYDIVHKHGGLSKAVGPFISIGTGVTPFDLFAKTSGNLPNALANFDAAKKHPSRTSHAHDAMTRLSHRDGIDVFPYYRFDGGRRLGEVELDEWESHPFKRLRRSSHMKRFGHLSAEQCEPGHITLDKMYVATAAYLLRRDVQHDLNECAKLLVKRRRLRTRDTSAWDRFASASFYECSYQGCEKIPINTAQLFKEHVRKKHYSALAEQPLEAAMEGSRRCWIYRTVPPSKKSKTKNPRKKGRRPVTMTSGSSSSSSSSSSSLNELPERDAPVSYAYHK
ncbi:MAG: hypothetical protein Q9170_001728 [Blastenia crenularia]